MSEKPPTFEQLKEISNNNVVSDVLRQVYNFIKEVGNIKNVSDIGITVTYKGIPIYQQESKNGLTVCKKTRVWQSKQDTK
ncbi:hypothetical protein [Bernardetia sp. MNP-M8]|uniref:hypothetical protein n=1 Tax=Bernardetia sp. MNP-M8 TaxID=3127470 RepID=UPI0030D16E91